MNTGYMQKSAYMKLCWVLLNKVTERGEIELTKREWGVIKLIGGDEVLIGQLEYECSLLH